MQGFEWWATHPSLEVSNFLISHGVGFRYHGNKVDFGVQFAHKFNVNLLQARRIVR
jgi:hypothetical protein